MLNYGTNMHYPCGHDRTLTNSISAGNGRWRCRACAKDRKQRLKVRKEEEANGIKRLSLSVKAG